MGANSYVLAIGNFDESIASYLDGPAETYADLPPETMICSELLHCATTQTSNELAAALNIDPYNIAEHYLGGAARVSSDQLYNVFENNHNETDVAAFVALRARGFTFFYRRNN